jgi:hypothetical protein
MKLSYSWEAFLCRRSSSEHILPSPSLRHGIPWNTCGSITSSCPLFSFTEKTQGVCFLLDTRCGCTLHLMWVKVAIVFSQVLDAAVANHWPLLFRGTPFVCGTWPQLFSSGSLATLVIPKRARKEQVWEVVQQQGHNPNHISRWLAGCCGQCLRPWVLIGCLAFGLFDVGHRPSTCWFGTYRWSAGRDARWHWRTLYTKER